MKVCVFCNTQNENSSAHCSSCNGNVFDKVCDNCGNTFRDGNFCPSCGVRFGQTAKICPECGSRYYTNACPSCGYTGRTKAEPVQQIVHNHYTVQSAPVSAGEGTNAAAGTRGKTKSKIGCVTILLWICFFPIMLFITIFKSNLKPLSKVVLVLMILGLIFGGSKTGNDSKSSSSGSKSSVTVTAAIPSVPTARTSLNGRGKTDTYGQEPQYINIIGYAVVATDAGLEKNAGFAETPWLIDTYVKDKQFWEKSGTVEHGTEVVVLEQLLTKAASQRYEGYLRVRRTDNGKEIYINVENFSVRKYWTYDITKAFRDGYMIAEFRQVSDYYPVTSSNKKVSLTDGTLVLIPCLSAGSSPDTTNNQITGVIWPVGDSYGTKIFFNAKDLTIRY